MDDRLKADIVEILADETGKIWVNVDGICVLRVGNVRTIVIDNKRDDNKEGRKNA